MVDVSVAPASPGQDAGRKWRTLSRLSEIQATPFVLGVVLLLAFGLRTYNVNWDRSQHLHPDERFISTVLAELRSPGSVAGYFDTEESSLNPYNHRASFVYGTLPLFATKALGEWLDRDADGSTHQSGQRVLDLAEALGANPRNADGSPAFDGGYNGNLLGRVLSALADTLTVLVVFELGRYLFSARVGVLGSAILALAPLPIQQGHFFTFDTFLTLFAACTLYLLVRAVRERRAAYLPAAGLSLGLALACKVSALLLLAPYFAILAGAVLIGARATLRERAVPSLLPRQTAQWMAGWASGLLFLLLAFRVFQPYAFTGDGLLGTFELDYEARDFRPGALLRLEPLRAPHYLALDSRFLDDLDNLRATQDGADFPPNAQWVDRPQFVWPLQNLALWGLGPFAFAAGLVGAIAATTRAPTENRPAIWLLLAWCGLVFAFYGRTFVPSMRYFMPAYPILAVFAGVGLNFLWTWRPRTLPLAQRFAGPLAGSLPGALSVGLLFGAVLFGLAFTFGVYGTEISRIQASRWMLDELPETTVISHENWDDGLPMQPPGFPPNPFETINMDLYGTDSRVKTIGIVNQLDRIDVVVLSSARLSGSIPRHPARYPAMTRYYAALEDGSLGFEKVAQFSNPPRLFGVTLDDSGAEEAFSVYDHPTVTLYQKTPRYSRDLALTILQPDRADASIGTDPGDASTNSLLLGPAAYSRQQAGGTWSDVFDPDGWASSLPWFWWVIWLELASLAAVPWVTWLCRSAPDRAYGLTKLLGPASVVLGTWLLVAWGLADFSRTLAWGVFASVLVAGILLGWLRRAELKAELSLHRRDWIATEVVFLGVFTFFLLLRAWNPDLWYHPTGGEKPMEVAYLTAVVRSTELPPYDPWFAGGYLNYYYMGWFFLAVPIRALQIVPEVAFNLAVPTFASMSAAVAFSGGNNLVRLSRLRPGTLAHWRGILGGLAAVFLLVFAGNLDAGHQAIERLQRISEANPTTGFPPFDGAAALAGGAWRWLSTSQPLAPFDWWRSSRVHFGSSDITEFPYWSFLFGDVHPHLMGIPFFVTVAVLALVYIATALAADLRRTTLLALLLGVLLATVRMVHTWDFPTAAALIAVAIALGQALAPGPRKRRMVIGACHLFLAAGTAQLIATPYLEHSTVFNQGVVRSATTTPPQQFLAHFGIFIAIAAAYVAVRYFEEHRRESRNSLVVFFGQLEWLFATATLTICLALFANEQGYMVIALSTVAVVVLGNLLWIELRRETPSVGEVAATAFLLLGLIVAASVDVLTVKDDIGRMNTVFKFSLQAWHFLALGCAFGALYVAAFLVQTRPPSRVGLSRTALRGTATRGVLVIFVLAALFPVMGTPARQDQRFGDFGPTLDGLRYLDADPTYTEDIGRPGPEDDIPLHLREDEPLIRWLRQNVQGSPTIVEAVGPLYHWTGRYSVNTGLPAVIGWDWHQIQQRGIFGAQIGKRRDEVRDFYARPETMEAERFLRRYDVSYVVVGPWERAFGTPEGIRKLEQMPALTRVFSSGLNAIYQVDKQALGHGVD